MAKKKVIGGLVSSGIKGSFIHYNTIEEYNAANLNEILAH
jgi:hypothetical protein